ncbi:MAG TPA: mannosyltransferase family protein, partial [Thermoleophilia bacterium]|nr:mannosyltransferase family protein [Thermoleophilia bacterium]
MARSGSGGSYLENDGSWQAPFALLAAVLSRVAVLLAGFLWVSSHGVMHVSLVIRDPRYAEALHGVAGRLIDPWAHWDGVWFVRIATTGYAHAHSTAFFPLYPLLMRALAPMTGGNYVIAGIVISLVSYGVAMVLLYKLAKGLFGATAAAWTVALISWFPTSVVFSAVYSESLFLMLTVAAFWFATRRR